MFCLFIVFRIRMHFGMQLVSCLVVVVYYGDIYYAYLEGLCPKKVNCLTE